VENIEKINHINEEAWNQETYNAWVERFGTPKEYIERIRTNPSSRLFPIYDYFGEVKDKHIMNLMGSNGTKAVALSMLGADVTIVDFSEGNKRYAEELAKEAYVRIEYIVSDVLKLPIEIYEEKYDIVFAELGIIHYFTDLKPFLSLIKSLLKSGGRMILRDFHPVSTKLISSRGSTANVRKHKVTGDYFDDSIEEREVAYSKYLEEGKEKLSKVRLRKWTLGEVVTAAANAGLFVEELREEPNLSSEVFDKGIPKTFTLLARKL
jgi:ubiquinone/menaquinone biosynthesis C-methylase UbiE